MDLQALHGLSSNHRDRVEASTECGCFYCEARFTPTEIEEWTDGDQTALCPKCGIDSVLPDQPTAGVLAAMNERWF